MQQEYEKAIYNLTIDEENRLKMQVKKLEIEKSQLEKLTADVALLKRRMRKSKILSLNVRNYLILIQDLKSLLFGYK